MRAKKGARHSVKQVNNPIRRRTDETKSVTSETVTPRRHSSPESASSNGATAALRGTQVFWSHCNFLWSTRLSAHTVALVSSQLGAAGHRHSLSNLSHQIYFLCAPKESNSTGCTDVAKKTLVRAHLLCCFQAAGELENLLSKMYFPLPLKVPTKLIICIKIYPSVLINTWQKSMTSKI